MCIRDSIYVTLLNYEVKKLNSERRALVGQVEVNDKVVDIEGYGNGPISSLVDALSNLLNVKLSVENYSEHSLGSGSATQAASFINLSYIRKNDHATTNMWGIGVSEDTGDASIRAVFATVNNIIHSGDVLLTEQ